MIIPPNGVPIARADIVREALTWLNTPFHPRAAVKCAGVECGWIIYGIMRDLGILPPSFVMPEYSQQFWAHRGDEVYVQGCLDIGMVEVTRPHPADMVLAKMGRLFAHGGIVVDWPWIIHSNPDAAKVTRSSVQHHRVFLDTPMRYFSLFRDQPEDEIIHNSKVVADLIIMEHVS